MHCVITRQRAQQLRQTCVGVANRARRHGRRRRQTVRGERLRQTVRRYCLSQTWHGV